MISDENLEKLSHEIDDMLGDLGIRYEINMLSLSSVVLARLALMNIYIGNREDFNRLIWESVLPVTDNEVSVH